MLYIGKKVDIVTRIPDWVGGEASLVGEVMLIRPDPRHVDPFVLLAYLRAPGTMEKIQKMIRGQTAHLHPTDMLSLDIPASVKRPSGDLKSLAKLLQNENSVAETLNELAYEQRRILSTIFN